MHDFEMNSQKAQACESRQSSASMVNILEKLRKIFYVQLHCTVYAPHALNAGTLHEGRKSHTNFVSWLESTTTLMIVSHGSAIAV